MYHISRQSSYLFGRERKVADVPVEWHGDGGGSGTMPKLLCRPYLMDLKDEVIRILIILGPTIRCRHHRRRPKD